ncbi:hypothetical protein I7I48_04775 [Histoplasma ohiense]|nr:hypothetical protein I7I48_04775 [Histoplasma ohiense (nom. inval.)]
MAVSDYESVKVKLQRALAHASGQIYKYESRLGIDSQVVNVFATGFVYSLLSNKAHHCNPTTEIALVGFEEDTEILSIASQCFDNTDFLNVPHPVWLQCPEFYRLQSSNVRELVLQDALRPGQKLILFESVKLRVFALPMLFAVGWASSLFDDPDGSAMLAVKSAADYLSVYLDMRGWMYLEFEYLRLCLERYGFDPDLEFYHWLNQTYFRLYGITYVVRSVPYS